MIETREVCDRCGQSLQVDISRLGYWKYLVERKKRMPTLLKKTRLHRHDAYACLESSIELCWECGMEFDQWMDMGTR